MTVRRRRGLTAHLSGLSAEETAARHYAARGGEILAQRMKTPEGEIDLIIRIDAMLVFVEVKQRKNNTQPGSPVTQRQWERLANAALHYMMDWQGRTGVQPIMRFDVALIGPDGSVQIIENARSFDEH